MKILVKSSDALEVIMRFTSIDDMEAYYVDTRDPVSDRELAYLLHEYKAEIEEAFEDDLRERDVLLQDEEYA